MSPYSIDFIVNDLGKKPPEKSDLNLKPDPKPSTIEVPVLKPEAEPKPAIEPKTITTTIGTDTEKTKATEEIVSISSEEDVYLESMEPISLENIYLKAAIDSKKVNTSSKTNNETYYEPSIANNQPDFYQPLENNTIQETKNQEQQDVWYQNSTTITELPEKPQWTSETENWHYSNPEANAQSVYNYKDGFQKAKTVAQNPDVEQPLKQDIEKQQEVPKTDQITAVEHIRNALSYSGAQKALDGIQNPPSYQENSERALDNATNPTTNTKSSIAVEVIQNSVKEPGRYTILKCPSSVSSIWKRTVKPNSKTNQDCDGVLIRHKKKRHVEVSTEKGDLMEDEQKSYQLHIVEDDKFTVNKVPVIVNPNKHTNQGTKLIITEDITLRGILGLDTNSANERIIKPTKSSSMMRIVPPPFRIAPVSSLNVPMPQKSRPKTVNSVYTSADKCAEVKHASTPMENRGNCLQTHTPQIPTPSAQFPLLIESSNCHKHTITQQKIVPSVKHAQNNCVASPSDLRHVADLTSAKDKDGDLLPDNIANCTDSVVGLLKRFRRHKPQFLNQFTVLNVPNLAVQCKVSRIEYAMRKRKRRKEQQDLKSKKIAKSAADSLVTLEWGIPVHGYGSDTSSSYNSSDYESDCCDIDLDIKSGPPEKPSRDKIRFLNAFGIGTQDQRNSVELAKIRSRQWRTPWMMSQAHVQSKVVALDLPVPSVNPLTLNWAWDFADKREFLRDLGLQTMPPNEQKDFEQNWVKVIHDRLKRDCESSLTKYSISAYRKQQFSILRPISVPKHTFKNRPQATAGPNMLPLVHQYAAAHKKLENGNFAMVLLVDQKGLINPQTADG